MAAGPQPDIQIQASPGEWNKAFGPNVFTLYNTSSSVANIYYLEIWNKDYSEMLASMRQNRNLYGVCHFDVQKILASNVEPQRGLEATNELATSEPETLEYNVKCGYIGTTGATIITAESSTTYKITMGRKPFNELQWDETPYISDWTAGFAGQHTIDTPADFLTDWNNETTKAALTGTVPGIYSGTEYIKAYTKKIRRAEQYTLSAINYMNVDGDDDLQLGFFRVYSYDSAGTLLDQITIDNITANGGGPNVVQCIDVGIEHPYLVITAQAGPDMLGLDPNTAYYYVWFGMSNTVSILGCLDFGSATNIWRFDIDEGECNDFTPVQLSWMNSYGFRDYFTFQKRNDNNITVTRDEYYELPGTWNEATFSINEYDRGRRIFSQSAEERWTLRTGYLTDLEAQYLKNLILSADVNYHIVEANDTTWYAATLETNRWIERTYRKDKLFQLEVTIKVSNNTTTQRG